MRDDDDLKPGVDKPTRRQYAIGVVVILFVLVNLFVDLLLLCMVERSRLAAGDPRQGKGRDLSAFRGG